MAPKSSAKASDSALRLLDAKNLYTQVDKMLGRHEQIHLFEDRNFLDTRHSFIIGRQSFLVNSKEKNKLFFICRVFLIV